MPWGFLCRLSTKNHIIGRLNKPLGARARTLFWLNKPNPAIASREHRGTGRRQRRRPLQETYGSGCGDRYIKRGRLREQPLQKVGGRYRRPLQEAGGGDVSGRYRKRAAVTDGRYRKRPLQAVVTGSGWRRCQRPLHKQCPEAGCLTL
jgi:hypothetical protein